MYPERTLVQARDDTRDARKLIRDGVDPSAQRKSEKRDHRIRAENTLKYLRAMARKSEGQIDDRPRGDDSAPYGDAFVSRAGSAIDRGD